MRPPTRPLTSAVRRYAAWPAGLLVLAMLLACGGAPSGPAITPGRDGVPEGTHRIRKTESVGVLAAATEVDLVALIAFDALLAEGKTDEAKANQVRAEKVKEGQWTPLLSGIRVLVKERRKNRLGGDDWIRVLIADGRLADAADAGGRKLNGSEWWLLDKDVEPVEAEAPKKAERPSKQGERQSPPKAQEPPAKEVDEKAEADAANNLAYVKRLLKRGEDDKARKRLGEILRDWPETEAGREARELLATLKEKSAAGAAPR